eukprot:4882524-Pleurochrysis_carterae.AAC.1
MVPSIGALAFHSLNQSLVAHTGSATGSDHCLHAPVVCKVPSNVYNHAGQIKGPGVRNHVVPGLSWDTSDKLRCVASLYATNTAVQSVAVLQGLVTENTLKSAAD